MGMMYNYRDDDNNHKFLLGTMDNYVGDDVKLEIITKKK